MLEEIPWAVDVLFLCTFGLTLVLFYVANGKARKSVMLILLWSAAISLLAYNQFFTDTNSIPPNFALAMIPAVLFIVYALLPQNRNRTERKRNRVLGTFMHLVRVPVEITLFFLFVHGTIPEVMTFAGRNFDVLSGLTAPVIAYLILKDKIGRNALIAWNVICCILVLTVLVHGLLSAEFPFQQLAFDQPNRAVMYFPYILLPAVIVPLVVYSHLHDAIVLAKKEDLKRSSS